LHKSEIIEAGNTNIIKQPPTPYGQSMPSEFYQGIINPLSKRILRQNIKMLIIYLTRDYIFKNFHFI
jgi:hypothetical protein